MSTLMALMRSLTIGSSPAQEAPSPTNSVGKPLNFHSWSKLPDKLKLMAIREFLTYPSPITRKKHDYWIRMRLIPLLRCGNEQLALMAKEAYYKYNIFQLTIGNIRGHGKHPLSMGQHVQKLEIRFALKDRELYPSTVLADDLGWAGGLDCGLTPNCAELQKLQAGLPNGVKELTIVMEIKPKRKTRRHGVHRVSWVPCLHRQAPVQDFNALVANITSLLVSEHYMFEVFCPCCPADKADCERKSCAAGPMYEKLVKEYIAGEKSLDVIKFEGAGYGDH
jgi:hypothetical protein